MSRKPRVRYYANLLDNGRWTQGGIGRIYDTKKEADEHLDEREFRVILVPEKPRKSFPDNDLCT